MKGRHKRDRLELLEVAYWDKGCSSLGNLRYAALGNLRYAALVGLMRRREGLRHICLIDVKEATRADAPRDPKAEMPRDNAERIVAGARALSPNLGSAWPPPG